MARNAVDLLSDDKKLALFRVQAKERAALFSLDKILPQYENLYQEVIKKNH
jgi:glycogen synthase